MLGSTSPPAFAQEVAHHVIWGEGIALRRACIRERAAQPACQVGRGLAEASKLVIFDSRPGHIGATPRPETTRRQPRQPTSEVSEPTGSNVSGTNQLVPESIDTVGVAGQSQYRPPPNAL